jgi:hypothetical protein
MILWGHLTSPWIKDECCAACMERGMPKIDSDATVWLPFWWSGVTRALCLGVQHVNWAKQCVKCFDRYVLDGNIV